MIRAVYRQPMLHGAGLHAEFGMAHGTSCGPVCVMPCVSAGQCPALSFVIMCRVFARIMPWVVVRGMSCVTARGSYCLAVSWISCVAIRELSTKLLLGCPVWVSV